MKKKATGSRSARQEILTRSDGATIAYHRIRGRTPGVIFLTGFRSDMTGDKAKAVETYCRKQGLSCLRFDYTGHGRSSGAFTDGTVGTWAADALFMLDHLTKGPQILVGSSMGGWIMLLLAKSRPKRIAGLLGIASAPDFTEDLIFQRLNRTQRSRLVKTGAIAMPNSYSNEPYTITHALIKDGRKQLIMRRTIRFSGPVRLLHGMKDTDVPWQTALALQNNLASKDVVVTLVKDGDHRLSRPVDLARLARTLDDLVRAVKAKPADR